MRISRIRLSQKRSAESTRRQLHGSPESEKLQAEALKVRIIRDSLRRTEGPLAASPQILAETDLHVFIDLVESTTGIPVTKVVPPAFQVSVQAQRSGPESAGCEPDRWSARAASARSRFTAFFDGPTFRY